MKQIKKRTKKKIKRTKMKKNERVERKRSKRINRRKGKIKRKIGGASDEPLLSNLKYDPNFSPSAISDQKPSLEDDLNSMGLNNNKWVCNRKCGFRGTYTAVEEHEKTCTYSANKCSCPQSRPNCDTQNGWCYSRHNGMKWYSYTGNECGSRKGMPCRSDYEQPVKKIPSENFTGFSGFEPSEF